jgi:hypothetical protein
MGFVAYDYKLSWFIKPMNASSLVRGIPLKFAQQRELCVN